jgi:DNA repair exonuclease SbcCD nuclease subunit
MINRAFIVSDTHFGANSNSIETLENMLKYFYNDFIPNILPNLKDTDCLIHCGDVFDNRQTINLMVMSKVVELFEKLGSMFKQGVHIIAGNHDILKKNSNDITSLDCLKHIKGVTIYKEPDILNVAENKKALLMSWRATKEDEKTTIANANCEYVFCHADIKSAKFDKFRDVEHGIELSDITNVVRLFSGHIHWGQRFANINLVGNPYEMTRSDANNKKGFWLYDFEFDEEIFFENTTSPKFLSFNLQEILDVGIENFAKNVKNQKVDIYVNEANSDKNISKILDKLKAVCLNVETFKANEIKVSNVKQIETTDLTNVVNNYIASTSYDTITKLKLFKKFENELKQFENENQ